MDLAGSAGSTFGYVLVAGDQVIVGGWRGYTDVVGLSRHDGVLTWTLPTRGRMLAAPVAAPDGTVLLTFPDENRALVIDGASGEVVGETSCPAPRGRPDATPLTAWADDGWLCLDADARVLKLDPCRVGDGWQVLAQHHRPIRSLRPHVAEDEILFEDEQGCLCAYSRKTGAHLWDTEIQHRRADALPVVAYGDHQVAFGAATGDLVLLDSTGHTQGRCSYGKAFEADLGISEDGNVLGATGGRLVAIKPVSADRSA